MKVKDIEGAQCRSKILPYRRQTNYIRDIEKAYPKKELIRKKHHDSLDVKDISKRDNNKLKRCINPLEPQYKVKGKDKYELIGKIIGNQSRVLHRSLSLP